MNRRDFIRTAAGAAAFTGLFAGCASCPCGGARKMKMAVQLYVLRKLAEKGLADVFAGIKTLGLDGVEMWNTPKFEAEDVHRLLDANGLECCGAHLSVDMLSPETIRKTLDYARTAGFRNLIVAWMQPDKNEKDVVGWWKAKAEFYNAAAETAGSYGCRVGYHNHYHEFTQRFGGKTLWEIFMENISKDVIIQLDVGSAAHVNEDPVYWYRRFPGRSPSVHFRDEWDEDKSKGFVGVVGEPPPGRKGVDWKALFAAMKNDITEWGVIEPVTSDTFDTVKRSLDNLKAMSLI